MNSTLLARWASRLIEAPLAVHPGKAASILAAVGHRFIEGGAMVVGAEALEHVAFANGRPSAGVLVDQLGARYARDGRRPYPVVDGVAVIAIEGSLVHKGSWVGMDSGETSYEGVQAQIRAVQRDRDVRGVVFEVDSFGGEVSGAFDLAEQIRAVSAKLPTIAILTDHAASAGYLLASQAREIVAPAAGGAGSIGVIALHVDRSGELAKKGQVVTVLTAGAHKADGNPFEALPEAVATRWRAELQALRVQFASAVAAARGGRLSTEQALATEARYFPAEEAVSLGLVDRIERPSAAFESFIRSVNRAVSGPYSGGPGMSLADRTGGDPATTHNADLEAATRTAVAEALAGERTRSNGIRQAGASQPKLADHLIEAGVSLEAATAILGAAKADTDAALEAAKAAAPTPLQELEATAPTVVIGAGGQDKPASGLAAAVDGLIASGKRR